MIGDTWPRLSKQLTGPRDPFHCQQCGVEGSLEPATDNADRIAGWPTLSAWQEHDAHDGAEIRVVVLCRKCADERIEKHPRLYGQLKPWAPFPGVMAICHDCPHRNGVDCTCPAARHNGGEGLAISYPKPSQVHFLRRGKGARSGWETVYNGPPVACGGKPQ